MPSEPIISVIMPARNEEALIAGAITAVLRAAAALDAPSEALADLRETATELIVVDNASTDRTATVVASYAQANGVRLVACAWGRAAAARNYGATLARGAILVFVDADTHMPAHTLRRIAQLGLECGYEAGITGLAALEAGWRARLWWGFWTQVRRLPIPRAKAMPALMFCTRDVFATFGPFDERVAIGEEWPILSRVYRMRPQRFIYDRTIVALTSNRRMELQPLGYLRTFLRYLWAILHVSGRVDYPDRWRHVRD